VGIVALGLGIESAWRGFKADQKLRDAAFKLRADRRLRDAVFRKKQAVGEVMALVKIEKFQEATFGEALESRPENVLLMFTEETGLVNPKEAGTFQFLDQPEGGQLIRKFTMAELAEMNRTTHCGEELSQHVQKNPYELNAFFCHHSLDLHDLKFVKIELGKEKEVLTSTNFKVAFVLPELTVINVELKDD
jgi:hypothetical protein